MGLTWKGKRRSSSNNEGWGMGFFLVFFPSEEEHESPILGATKRKTVASAGNPLSLAEKTLSRRTNSTHILSKTQSTISICALLIFLTLLLFTLSTFEPNSAINSRRLLSSTAQFRPHSSRYHEPKSNSVSHALQGMGNLYTRGTGAMNDLVICHVTESLTVKELQLFLRMFLRSSLSSKSDLLFLLPSSSSPFRSVIEEETESFLILVQKYKESLNETVTEEPLGGLSMTRLLKSGKELERGEAMWGKRIRGNSSEGGESGSTRPSRGSVVSFEVGELDPENSLGGFLDRVPMSLRRWASYQMLLGRVRRNFKHVILVDPKSVLLLGDPLGRVSTRSPESVLLFSTPPPKHGRKTSDRTHRVNPAVIAGGTRGIRRLSSAMLAETVRAATQRKRKGAVTEMALLSQLLSSEFLSRTVDLALSSDPVPELSSLGGPSSLNYTVVRRGNTNADLDAAIIMRHICSHQPDSSVYSDC